MRMSVYKSDPGYVKNPDACEIWLNDEKLSLAENG